MAVLKRTLILRAGAETPGDLYDAATTALRLELAQWLAAQGGPQNELAAWPHVNWSGESASLSATEWRSGSGERRLLEVQYNEPADAGATWCTRLSLCSVESEHTSAPEVTLFEERTLSPYQPKPNLIAAPDHLAWTNAFERRNADRFPLTALYRVNAARAERFIEFLAAPRERRSLPVVLVSRLRRSGDFGISPDRLAAALHGLAYVATIDLDVTNTISERLPQHSCFNGAVRLYLPGFSPEDSWRNHPYWKIESAAEHNHTGILNAIVRHVADYLAGTVGGPEEIAALRSERDSADAERRMREQVEALTEQLREKANAEANQQFSELVEEFERIQQEAADLRRENTRLRSTVQHLKMENLRLSTGQATLSFAEQSERVVELSSKAQQALQAYDPSERIYWHSRLLPKLLNEQQTEAQSEAVGGGLYVFPRSRTNDGRRAIYFKDASAIRICEIFADHDKYEAFRSRPANTANYGHFVLWESPMLAPADA